jgi:beta-glucosidase
MTARRAEPRDVSSPSDLPLHRLIASLLVVRASGFLADHQRRYPRWELPNEELRALLEQGVGGVILLGGSAAEVALRCRQLQDWADRPLLLCADVEEGVGQRFEGASWLVPPLALGRLHRRDPDQALELAQRYGRCCGRDARRLGLNWLLAPVCDVNNNPANPVINVRAFAEEPAAAAALTTAFIRGARATGVLTCAKHFPGHGDTSSDSHLELPVLTHSRSRLEAVELPPFAAAIAAGVNSVMTAHLMLPALDPERPATLSAAVLRQLLRSELGFEGLVVTDALVMEAIAGRYGAGEAAVLALEAGADLVLMPADARAALEAIAAAVASGRLSRSALERAADRRRRALALLADDPAQPDPLAAARPDTDLIEALLRASLERHGGQRPAPAGRAATGLNLIRLDNSLAAPFLPADAPALAMPLQWGFSPCLLEQHGPSPWSGEQQTPLALERLGAGPVLLQLFIRGNPFRGSAGGGEPWAAAVRQLLAADRLAGLAVYGSPYLWEELRDLLPDRLPAAYSPGQMPAAQRTVLESLGMAPHDREGGFTD